MRKLRSSLIGVGLALIGMRAFALDPQFKLPVDYPVGLSPDQICTADFNADGKPDLAIVNTGSNTVSILLNTGTGTFAPAVTYPVGNHPVAICTIDVDADGRPDLAVANYGAATVSILMNLALPSGAFDVAVDYPTGGIQPTAICAGDFDGDGKIDLAVANYGSGNVSVMINFNNSKFPTFVLYPTGTNPTGIAAADFNMDGKMDLAVSNQFDNNVSVLRNTGLGIFAATVNYPVGVGPIAIAAADVDGNGSPDIVTANSTANSVSVLKNTGAGLFGASTDYPVGMSPHSILIADLDKDGKPELTTANVTSNDISILRNTGGGMYSAAVSHAVGNGPQSVCAADFDSDLMPDLAVTNSVFNSVSVLIGRRQFSINATAGMNGAISPSGVVGTYEATDQAFTITPNTGYHVGTLTVDGGPVAPATTYTFTAIAANHTINAAFAINQYTTTATAGPNGSITPNSAVIGNYGSSQSFTIAPNLGYHVFDVSVDGVSQGAITSWSIPFLDANHTINATFAINTYTLTASVGVNGSITPSGVTTVNYGGGQTYLITPAGCYHVADVQVDGVSVGALTSYPFGNVGANHTISATFAINIQTVAATAGPHGSITPSGTVPVNCGSNQSFTMAPASPDWHIASVLVDGSNIGAVSSYTFLGVTSNRTISVAFAGCCVGTTGNVDGSPDGVVDISDVFAMVDFLSIGRPLSTCGLTNDVNKDGVVDISDLFALIDYLSGAAPLPACPV